jgi:hypothetical protein
MRREAMPFKRWKAVLAAGAAFLAGACELEPKPGSESIFDYLGDETTPLQAAEMAENPYNANDRYRGTLMLANAYYAGEPVYIELFERRIVDEDPNVRTAGARGLANHGQSRHVGMLVRALQDDPDAFVRREAARGLQRLYGEEAVGPLIRAMKASLEPDRDVRTAAASALGQYPEARVLDALIEGIEDDPQLAVNRAALDSLRTLTGQDLGLSRAEWVRWRESTQDPFAQRRAYLYPVFTRDKYFYEYLPFTPDPPNEVSAPPTGLPAELRDPATSEVQPKIPPQVTPENPPQDPSGAPPQEPDGR